MIGAWMSYLRVCCHGPGSAVLIALGLSLVAYEARAQSVIQQANPIQKGIERLNPFQQGDPLQQANPANKLQGLSKTCTELVKHAQNTQEQVNKTRRDIWSEVRNAAETVGANVEQDVVLYDLAGTASFTYNAYAGTTWYQFILPGGVMAEKGKVNVNQEGNYSVPDVSPKDVVKETGFVKIVLKNTYDDWAKQKKAQRDRHVYVASKRFVDILGAENAIQEAWWAYVTAGSSARGSLMALKEQLLLEWADIQSWLRQIGAENSDKVAEDLAKFIHDAAKPFVDNKFKGDPVTFQLPRLPNLSVKVELIDYKYEITPNVGDEMTRILPVLSKIGYDGKKGIPKLEGPVPHLTFSFSITNPHSQSSTDNEHYEQLLLKLVDRLQNGPLVSVAGLADKIPIKDVDIGKLTQDQGSTRAKFARALSTSLTEAKNRHKGDGVFDFSNSTGAEELKKKLEGLMIGNNKDAKVSRLVVDVAAGSVTFDVDLKSKHVLLKVNILEELDKFWTKKNEEESKVFKVAFNKAGTACEDLARACQSLAKPFKMSREVCGNAPLYQTLALAALSRPAMAPSEGPGTPDRGDVDDPSRPARAFFPPIIAAALRATGEIEVNWRPNDPLYKKDITFTNDYGCQAVIIASKYALGDYECFVSELHRIAKAQLGMGGSPSEAANFGYGPHDFFTVRLKPVAAEQDWAVLRVVGDPARHWGAAQLTSRAPAIGDDIFFMSSPVSTDCRVIGNPDNFGIFSYACRDYWAQFRRGGFLFSKTDGRLLGIKVERNASPALSSSFPGHTGWAIATSELLRRSKLLSAIHAFAPKQ